MRVSVICMRINKGHSNNDMATLIHVHVSAHVAVNTKIVTLATRQVEMFIDCN